MVPNRFIRDVYRIELAISLNEFRKKVNDNEYEIKPVNSNKVKIWMYTVIVISLTILSIDFTSVYNDVQKNGILPIAYADIPYIGAYRFDM